jgi:hypothetical protein
MIVKVFFLFFTMNCALFIQSSILNPYLKLILPLDLISFVILFSQICHPMILKISSTFLGILFIQSQSLSPSYFHSLIYFSSLSLILWTSNKILDFSFKSLFLIGFIFFFFKSFLIFLTLQRLIEHYSIIKHSLFLFMFLIVNILVFPLSIFFLNWLDMKLPQINLNSLKQTRKNHEI